jgi:FAD dependent oxidoreductase TIGR03364
MSKSYDIVVIGGGILGISHAYHCLKAGLKVALLEKNVYPHDATVRNFGQIVPSGLSKEWQQYGIESLKIYNEIQSCYDISVKQGGSLYVASDDEEVQLIEELAEINKLSGYKSRLLTKNECLKEHDYLLSSYTKAGLFFPDEITLDPLVAGRKIIEYCIAQLGLEFFGRRHVIEINKTIDDVVVTCSDKSLFRSQKVILCNGSDYSSLYPQEFTKADIQLVKLQMMETVAQNDLHINASILTGWTIRRYESFRECPSYPSIKAHENKLSYHNKMGIHLLFKQSSTGSIIIGDSHEYVDLVDANSIDYNSSNEINSFLLSQSQRIISMPDWSILRTWNGYYSQCKTNDIYEATIDDHIHVVTAIGGKGMTSSLGYAQKAISEYIVQNESVI